MREFPPEVIEELGSYVYLYIDPQTAPPFYVGKGVGNRAFDHLYEKEDSDKVARIEKIKASDTSSNALHLVHLLDSGQLDGKTRKRILKSASKSQSVEVQGLFQRFLKE